jgi:hypothetical protein
MVSIAIASAASVLAIWSFVAVIAADQIDDKTGRRAADRDSSRDAQECDTEAAVSAAAKNESDAAGDRQRGQRFFSYIFADVAIAPAPLFIRFACGGPC